MLGLPFMASRRAAAMTGLAIRVNGAAAAP